MKYIAPITDYVKKSTGDYVKKSTFYKSVFFPVMAYDTYYTSRGILLNNLVEGADIYFQIPYDLDSIIDVKLVVYSNITNIYKLDYIWQYGKSGEAYNIHNGHESYDYGLTVTINQLVYLPFPDNFIDDLEFMDIGSIRTEIELVSFCDLYVWGMSLKYSIKDTG